MLRSPQNLPYTVALHKPSLIVRRKLRQSGVAQIAVLVAIWFICDALARHMGLPIPGSVIGLFALLGALAVGIVKTASIRRGARWFLAELLLFFVPAVLAVLDHPEFLGMTGIKVLAVILVGVICVMVTTALAVDFGFRMMARLEKPRP